uniref:Uncharacterized protein n=1 Tax=Vitis vinifera TaxID=29760 RepID=F6GTL8_VITVI
MESSCRNERNHMLCNKFIQMIQIMGFL